MASQVEICNRALIRLGADTITDILENSKEGRLCNIVYDQIRKDVLRSHPWNFAIKRSILAPDPDEAPDFDFLYYLNIPSDCLRVLKIQGNMIDYKIEGNRVLCNDEAPELIYIADIENTELFDSMFVSLFVNKLALELAYNLSGSASVVQLLMAEQRELKIQARMTDGQEGFPESFSGYSWLDERF